MSVSTEFKCKNCGNVIPLHTAENGVLRCEYCLSTYTLPKETTDSAALDFLRAGELELEACAFDRAYIAFRKCAERDENEPEAYFGMALAENKIRYIKDNVANRLQPVCHAVSGSAFTQNSHYAKALALATQRQREEYVRKGEEIDVIRKAFLSLQNEGVQYDCFLCVKVTDPQSKEKTADYKIADDLYFHLRGKGFRPFLSERELQNLAGADYEARILYALYTAKCMLVVCSDESFLQTPWMKNEYMRYLSMTGEGGKSEDSITVVFSGTPVEILPGKSGRIQGIDMCAADPYGKATEFVQRHVHPAANETPPSADEPVTAKTLYRRVRDLASTATRFAVDTVAGKLAGIEKKFTQTAEEKEKEEQRRREIAARRVAERKQKAKEKKERKTFRTKKGTLVRYKGKDAFVRVPDYVRAVGKRAFRGRKLLQGVILPDTVESIGKGAFKGCKKLRSVRLPRRFETVATEIFTPQQRPYVRLDFSE